MFHLNNIFFLLMLCLFLQGCTEAYPLVTNTYEEALIVEGTITNQLKKQEIKLTKSSKFEDKTIHPETGANVYITDDSGNRYDFEEETDSYISKTEFQAIPKTKYQLHIATADGRAFESSPETLTTETPIESLKAAVETTEKNGRGVAIRVNSFDPTNTSKYYRYEYEETYKIVTPRWTSTKATLDQSNHLVFVPNSTDTKVCYGSKKSTDLLILNTNDQTEDRVNYLIRFISDQNYIITTRYSILVTQYIESLNAYTYYKNLKKMSGSESILSPTQPGVLLGNLRDVNNTNSKVLGYFDIASVSTERLYFNYSDLFPGEGPPPYYEPDCKEFCYAVYPLSPDPCTHSFSGGYSEDLESDIITFIYFQGNFNYWVNAACGDCTTFASNIKPPFWTD